MLFTPHIHTCTTRKQRDFVEQASKALRDTHVDNAERLACGLVSLAELNGLLGLRTEREGTALAVVHEGSTIMTWLALN